LEVAAISIYSVWMAYRVVGPRRRRVPELAWALLKKNKQATKAKCWKI